jgi:hypothetical protein
MTTLKDFPLLMRGMLEIQRDQYISGMDVNLHAEIDDYWLPRFRIAEEGLRKLVYKKLGDVMPAVFPETPGYEDLKQCLNDNCLYHFYLPLNDFDAHLADWTGMTPTEYFYAHDILGSFFDGPLMEVFEVAVPGTPFHKLIQRRSK